MLKTALVMTILVSSSVAYALNNSDLLQLNLQTSRQQQEQRDSDAQLLEQTEQATLRQDEYLKDLTGRQQQDQLRQKQYLQELLWESQRRQDTHEFEERRLRDILLEQRQSGLFQ